jgi:hypothetical protein
VDQEPDIREIIIVAAEDVDSLWSQFTSEDDSVLDYLVALGEEGTYCHDLPAQVRELLTTIKVVLRKSIPSDVASKVYCRTSKTNKIKSNNKGVGHEGYLFGFVSRPCSDIFRAYYIGEVGSKSVSLIRKMEYLFIYDNCSTDSDIKYRSLAYYFLIN